MATITTARNKLHEATDKTKPKARAAVEFTRQAERLGHYAPDQEGDTNGSTEAIEARFVTAQDPVIVTADGGRLPAVPVEEAIKLNKLRDTLEGRDPSESEPVPADFRESRDGTIHGVRPTKDDEDQKKGTDAPLGESNAPSKTNPMFPPYLCMVPQAH